MVRLQSEKFSRYIMAHGENFLNVFNHISISQIEMKIAYVIPEYKSLFSIKKGINILYTGLHNVFRCIMAYGGNFLKHILTFLYCTKYNEINICHSYVQQFICKTTCFQ